jgi:hypothetical protein
LCGNRARRGNELTVGFDTRRIRVASRGVNRISAKNLKGEFGGFVSVTSQQRCLDVETYSAIEALVK